MRAGVIGFYVKYDKVTAYKLVDVDTGEFFSVYKNKLEELMSDDNDIQKLWSEQEGHEYRYEEELKELGKDTCGNVILANAFITYGVMTPFYRYTQVLVWFDTDSYIIYDCNRQRITRLDRIEALAMTGGFALPHEHRIVLDGENNVKQLMGSSYTDKFGRTHIIDNEYGMSTFVVPNGIKHLAEVNVKGAKKIIFGKDVIGVRLTDVNGKDEETDTSSGFNEEVQEVDIRSARVLFRNAFIKCSNLESIKIPDTVEIIGEMAFRSCNSLNKVDLPNSIKYIGSEAFRNCRELTEIHVPEKVRELRRGVFEDCLSLSKVELPDGLVRIGERAFKECRQLASIELPKSVKRIERGAFSNSRLKSIEIPENVEYIGDRAFYGCMVLEEVVINSINIHIEKTAFNAHASLRVVKVHRDILDEINKLEFELPNGMTSTPDIVIID